MRLSLPIDAQLPGILASLRTQPNLVLQADPGAGKTTRVPPALLEACTALHTLSLHGCPLTVEALRGTAGWAAFDARRRAKYDKQVDMRVLPAASFDEGADVDQFEHWRT